MTTISPLEDLPRQEARRRVLRACLELGLVEERNGTWTLSRAARTALRDLAQPALVAPTLGFGFPCSLCRERDVASRMTASGVRLCVRCEERQINETIDLGSSRAQTAKGEGSTAALRNSKRRLRLVPGRRVGAGTGTE
jgi:hypothetical protein